MALEPESLYRQLGQLVTEIPNDLVGNDPVAADTYIWLGRAAILVEEAAGGSVEGMYDQVAFTQAADGLRGPLRDDNAHSIVNILHRALARAELRAPAAAHGAFIPVGAAFDAYQAIGKAAASATSNVLFVDPYMDGTVLSDFAAQAPENVTIRLLNDSQFTKVETMRPPAERWIAQYKGARPLEVRFAAPRSLHDRLILVDHTQVWSLTQSLKDFAKRSPASVLRVESEVAALKVAAYEAIWAAAKPL